MTTWQLTLKDGTVIPITMCGAADGVLWITVPDLGINEAVSIFSLPSKTEKITAYGTEKYNNYTELINLTLDHDGQIRIALRQSN